MGRCVHLCVRHTHNDVCMCVYKSVVFAFRGNGSDVEVSGGDVEVSGSDLEVSGSDVEVSGSDVEVSGSDVEVV